MLYGQKEVNRLIDQIKDHPQSITMTLPGWLIRTAVNIASTNANLEEDEEVWLSMAKDIKKVRFSVVENKGVNPHTSDEMLATIPKILADGYDKYASVRDGGNNVEVLVRENNDEIQNILLFVHGESLVAIHLNTEIPYEKFKKANFSFNK
jgi:hypothetical protein